MKRLLLYLFISSLLISGCSSSDDDDMSQNLDLIVGVWKLVNDVEVCSNGSESVEVLTTCQKQSTVEFTKDGTIHSIDYYTEDCEDIDSPEISIGTYTLDGKTITINWPDELNPEIDIIFELTTDKMKAGNYFIDLNRDSFDCDGIPDYAYYEFVRVE
jgi:hypothetical protein